MPAFHVVIKLLMLRLLLASLSGLSDQFVCLAYDFGYHPSAEEFDSLLRDTRTWTRNAMANERHRKGFVPRYNYQQQAPKGEFNFQLFDDDDDQEQQEQQQLPFIYETVPTIQQQQQQEQGEQLQHVQSQLLQINDAPTATGASGGEGGAAAASPHSTASNNSSNTHTGNNFPIFFTNPATGIVYAISEVGSNTKSQPWPSNDSDNEAIAIYVTKAQYDADLKAMRMKYEQQCPLINDAAHQSTSQPESPFPTVSMAITSTGRPQIIRLQKPKKTKLPAAVAAGVPKPLGSNKLPYRPPPVMVTTGNKDTISDQLLKLPTSTARPATGSPSRTPKPKRSKRKKKKKLAKRRPGHKQPASTAGPQIVLGKRTTSSPPASSIRVATQLEKPHMPEPTATAAAAASTGTKTIFSEQPIAVSSGYLEVPHRLSRRSVDAIATNAAARPVSSGRRRRPSSTGRRRPGTGTGTGNKPKGPAKNPTSTSTKDQTHGGNGYRIPHAVHLLHSKHNDSDEEHTGKPRGMKRKSRKHNSEDLDLFELMTGAVGFDDEDDDGIDDEHNNDNYYDDDSDNDNANEDNDDNDDGDDDEDKQKKFINRRKDNKEKPSQENSSSAEEGADFGAMEELPSSSSSSISNGNSNSNSSSNSSSNNISNNISSSSSTELPMESEAGSTDETLSSSKHSTNKKRIKRRPAGVNPNVDDYYDDDDDDDAEEEKDNDDDDDDDGDFVADSGIGSFFRMIFYPVQMAMSRIFDGFNDQSTEQSMESSTLKPKYPTYTLYHSAHSNNELIDDDDDELDVDDDDQSSSLGNWFSSWFGYRRRNKKIGSTTTMPEAPLPLPTPAPSAEPVGWLESWFGFGKTTAEASSEEDGYDSE